MTIKPQYRFQYLRFHFPLFVLLLCTMSCCCQRVSFQLYSKTLHDYRKIWLSLPPQYESRRDSFHLVILLDGNNESLLNLTVASKRFIEGNAVDLGDFNAPVSIVVGVEQKDRAIDFVDSSERFQSFLCDELIPFIRKTYRTIPFTILVGHSLAGKFAIEAFLNRPRDFNAIVSVSPAFTEKYASAIAKKVDSVFSDSLLSMHAWFISNSSVFDDNTERHFHGFAEAVANHIYISQPKKLLFQFDSSSGLGHAKTPLFGIPRGFTFVYAKDQWYLPAMMRNKILKDAAQLEAVLRQHSDAILSKWDVPFRDNRWQLLAAYAQISTGEKEAAKEILLRSIDIDPTQSDQVRLLIQLLKETGDKRWAGYKKRFSNELTP